MLLEGSASEVVSVAISPLNGTPYPLIRQGDTFVLLGQEDTALRSLAVEDLIMSLEQLPAQEVVLADITRETTVSPADFGLDPALVRVIVTYADGSKKDIRLGDRAPDPEKLQRYCMVDGDPRLFTVLAADGEAFWHDAAYWVEFDQPHLDASLLDRIEIAGDIVWDAVYTPSGWQMEAPFSYPLSTLRTDALLKKIEGMGFETYLGKADQVDLALYGLDNPALTVRLTQAASVITGETTDGETVTLPVPEKSYTLLLGNETGKSGVYLVWEGQVFQASNFVLGFWKELNPLEYLLQTPVNFLLNDLNAVTLSAGDSSRRYEVRMVESVTENNQIAVDEYGRTLYDVAVRRAGESRDMDAEAFADWYTRLATLSADGDLPAGFALTGESRASILLENDHLTRLIEFYPFDALHDALAVDGAALYYVQKTWLDSVMDAP